MTGDLSNIVNQLAIICGLMFVPHIWAVFFLKNAVFAFFESAGYRPVGFFVYFSAAIKTVVAVCLILGFWIKLAAFIAALFMVTAGISVLKVSKGRWLWNIGGCELHFFWAGCCLLVALHS